MMGRNFIRFALSLIVLMVLASPDVHSEPLDADKVWNLISIGECLKARNTIKPYADTGQLQSSPAEMCLYAKSVCCSPPDKVSNENIDEAVGYLIKARGLFVGLSDSDTLWLEDVHKQCEETRLSAEDGDIVGKNELIDRKKDTIKIMSSYHGKIMAGCESPNLSPALIPGRDTDKPQFWRYLALKPGSSVIPPAEFLGMLEAKYVGNTPEIGICAPFITLSDSQNPQQICNAAHRFTDYVVEQYGSMRPPTWIPVYHYTQKDQPYEHANKTTGEIKCAGVLGYYDWRRQSIIFRAPPGYFGTFRHELTHALLFWDIPLAPRWFEEGLAALYENTDSNFRGLENPWRERVLKKYQIKNIDRKLLKERVLSISILEFEHSPVHATISREFLRKLQQGGKLPALYDRMRKRYRQREYLKELDIKPHKRPTKEMVDAWYQMIPVNPGG